MDLGKSLCVLILLASSTTALAADVPCEGCSYSQMSSKAIQLGKGQHRIFNLSTNSVHGFNVVCEGDVIESIGPGTRIGNRSSQDSGGKLVPHASVQSGPSSCPFGAPLRADVMELSAGAIAAFNAAHDFYVLNGNNASDIQVDYRGNTGVGLEGDSVYGVLSDYQIRTSLLDNLEQSNQTVTAYLMAVAAMVAGNFNVLSSTLFIDITFKDGSKVTVVFKVNERKFEVVKNSARNPNGSAVVEGNAAGYQGNYPMNGNDLAAYLTFLRSMGVTITSGSTSGSRMICSWDGTKLTCTVVPN